MFLFIYPWLSPKLLPSIPAFRPHLLDTPCGVGVTPSVPFWLFCFSNTIPLQTNSKILEVMSYREQPVRGQAEVGAADAKHRSRLWTRGQWDSKTKGTGKLQAPEKKANSVTSWFNIPVAFHLPGDHTAAQPALLSFL